MPVTDYLNVSNFNKVKDGFQRFIVSPAQQFGLAGFVFDVKGETSQTSANEITDHYVEDNSAVQDHVASRPKVITLSGYVGEVVFKEEQDNTAGIRSAIEKATVLAQYLPALSASAKQLKDGLVSDNPLSSISLDNVSDIYSTVKNLSPVASKQQQAYIYFETLRVQKVLMSVQTPFEFVKNMVVESIIAVQGADTEDISSFTITLKEIRKVETIFTKFDSKKYESKSGQQIEEETVKGKAQGEKKSWLASARDYFKQ